MDASIAQTRAAGEPCGAADAPGDEDGLFDAVREQAEPMIAWARGGEALAMEHGPLEARALADGLELVRLLTQAHLDLRAVREQRRGDMVIRTYHTAEGAFDVARFIIRADMAAFDYRFPVPD